MRERWDSKLIGKKFMFLGTVFLKHDNRKGWFQQLSVYIGPEILVFTHNVGKGKGPQGMIEKSLGSEIQGSALTNSAIGVFALEPWATLEEGIQSAKRNLSEQYANAQWLWAK